MLRGGLPVQLVMGFNILKTGICTRSAKQNIKANHLKLLCKVLGSLQQTCLMISRIKPCAEAPAVSSSSGESRGRRTNRLNPGPGGQSA